MGSETKWVDWHPKVGDVRPAVYRCRRCLDGCWRSGTAGGKKLSNWSHENFYYQIPAPKEATMTYWQPRVEPMAKGWTLADVPENVLCEVTSDGINRFSMMRKGDRAIQGRGAYTKLETYDPKLCCVIRVIDPIPADAMTLDKVPEGVRCVVAFGDDQFVVLRRGNLAVTIEAAYSAVEPIRLYVLFILDPLPEVSVTLDALPVGRVMEQEGSYWFKSENHGWFHWFENVGVIRCGESPDKAGFQVTDIIMELKEVV